MRWTALFLTLVGCAEAHAPGEANVKMPEQPATATVASVAPPPTAAEAPPEPVASEELPPIWTLDAPNVPKLGYAEAMTRARTSRDAFKKLPAPQTTDASLKAWFVRVAPLADEGSRYYAAAYHAADASAKQRVDAISEAAELDALLARKLDELGLTRMPDAWRTEPTIRASFEDVADGPARRWRDESRALAKHCVEVAKSSNLTADVVARCSALRSSTAAKLSKGDASPCGCAPGDPLCSASLGGWCKD